MLQMLQEISLPGLPWAETLVVSSDEQPELPDIADDLKREVYL